MNPLTQVILLVLSCSNPHAASVNTCHPIAIEQTASMETCRRELRAIPEDRTRMVAGATNYACVDRNAPTSERMADNGELFQTFELADSK